jgi:UDP-N-acetylmuramate dehydrogenase
MNAGGHGSDMAQSLVRVRVVDLATGDQRQLSLADLGLGFRSSVLGRSLVVTEAELALAVGDRSVAEAEISDIVRWRRENQPGGANAGSVFVNPRPDSAGRLVDESGAKGLRVGSAEVSTKHANFIQVDDGGSANDVAALMAAVRAQVRDHTGVDLHAETHFLGFAPERAAAAGAQRVEDFA